MSPSELSWLQGCLFLFLGLAGGYGLNRCQNRRNNHGTSDVELGSIVVDNGSTPPPSDDADSSGGDEEARSPWNLSNPAGEAMVFTGAPRGADRNRLRSKSRRRSRRRLQPPAETRKKRRFLEFVVKTAAPNLATAYSTIVADRTSSPMSSPTEGLLRLSGGGDEALSPSQPVREVLASPGTPSCPDRKRSRSDSCRRMNASEKWTKNPFANFMAQDEARNVGTLEPANIVAADSSSTSMASKTAVLRRPPRRHFVPRPSLEIPLLIHVQARASDGLRFRSRQEQTAVSTPRRIGPRYKGISQRNGKWVSEIRVGGTREKVWLGTYNTEKEAALAFDAGKHHCSARKSTNFNFADSPRLLGAPENLMHLSSVERRTRIRRLAEDHARTYGNAHIH